VTDHQIVLPLSRLVKTDMFVTKGLSQLKECLLSKQAPALGTCPCPDYNTHTYTHTHTHTHTTLSKHLYNTVTGTVSHSPGTEVSGNLIRGAEFPSPDMKGCKM